MTFVRRLLASLCLGLSGLAVAAEPPPDTATCPDCTAWLHRLHEALGRERAARLSLEDTPLAADLTAVRTIEQSRPDGLTLRHLLDALGGSDTALRDAAFDLLIARRGLEARICLDCELPRDGMPGFHPGRSAWMVQEASASHVMERLLRFARVANHDQLGQLASLLLGLPIAGLPADLRSEVLRMWRSLPGYAASLRYPSNDQVPASVLTYLGIVGIDDPSAYEHLMRLASAPTLSAELRQAAAYFAAVNRSAPGDADAVAAAMQTLRARPSQDAALTAAVRLSRVSDAEVDALLLAILNDPQAGTWYHHLSMNVLLSRLVLAYAVNLPDEFKREYAGLQRLSRADTASQLAVSLQRRLAQRPAIDTEDAYLIEGLLQLDQLKIGKPLEAETLLRPLRSPAAALMQSRALQRLLIGRHGLWLHLARRWKALPASHTLQRAALRHALLGPAWSWAMRESLPHWTTHELREVRELAGEMRQSLAAAQDRLAEQVQVPPGNTPDVEATPAYLRDWVQLSGFRDHSVLERHALAVGYLDTRMRLPGGLDVSLLGSRDPNVLVEPTRPSMYFLPTNLDQDPELAGYLQETEITPESLAQLDAHIASRRPLPELGLSADLAGKLQFLMAVLLGLGLVQVAFALPSIWYYFRTPERAVQRACEKRQGAGGQGKEPSVLLGALGMQVSLGDLPHALTYWIARRPSCLWAWTRAQHPAARGYLQRLQREADVLAYFPRVPAEIHTPGHAPQRLAELQGGTARMLMGLDRAPDPRRMPRLVITGPGGSGKTTLSLAFAQWALGTETDGLANHGPHSAAGPRHPITLMLGSEFLRVDGRPDQDTRRLHIDSFFEALEKAARAALPEAVLDRTLLRQLLQVGALVPLIDHLSEAAADTRATVQAVLAEPQLVPLCIVTSRDDEAGLTQQAGSHLLRLLPLDFGLASDLYRLLVEAALRARGDSMNLTDTLPYYQTAQAQLASRTVGDAGMSPLLVSLVARLALGRIDRVRSGSRPDGADVPTAEGVVSDPELVRRYVQELAWDATPARDGAERDRFLTRVLVDAKALAWACMREALLPGSIEWEAARGTLEGESPEAAEARLDRLLHAVRLLRTPTPDQRDRVRFVLDPICETLAGLYLADHLNDAQALPQPELDRLTRLAEAEPAAPFLAVLRACLEDMLQGRTAWQTPTRARPLLDALRTTATARTITVPASSRSVA